MNFNWLPKHIQKVRSTQDFNKLLYRIKFSYVNIVEMVNVLLHIV